MLQSRHPPSSDEPHSPFIPRPDGPTASPKPSGSLAAPLELPKDTSGGVRLRADLVVLFVVSLLTFCTTISACVTDVFTLDTATVDARVTLWNLIHCVYPLEGPNCPSTTLPITSLCPAKQSRDQALQAFAILAILFSVPSMVAAGLSLLGKPLPSRFLPLIFFAATWFWVFLGWSVMAGTYREHLCAGLRSYSEMGFKMSSSFALNLCTWLIMTGSMMFHVTQLVGS